jgi:uroporphyrinogen decarboxylase
MREHLGRYPERVHAALEAITVTLEGFARACREVGVDGLFYATTGWATYEQLTDAEYEEFGRPYDVRVLKAADGAPFNILHVCRRHNMLWKLIDDPAQAVNWATTDATNPPIGEVWQRSHRPLIGGVDHLETLRHGTPVAVAGHVRSAVGQMREGLLMGPGCSISPQTPAANLRAARATVDAWGSAVDGRPRRDRGAPAEPSRRHRRPGSGDGTTPLGPRVAEGTCSGGHGRRCGAEGRAARPGLDGHKHRCDAP